MHCDRACVLPGAGQSEAFRPGTLWPSIQRLSPLPRAALCLFLHLCRSINAAMNLFGDSHELDNAGKAGKAGAVRWTHFWYGCFAGIVPWACVFAYLGGAGSTAGIPGFVYAICFVYLALFFTFPINMWLQYRGIGWWSDARWPDVDNGGYLFGEKVYQVLSLVAKSLLLWLVIGGSNQPSASTQ